MGYARRDRYDMRRSTAALTSPAMAAVAKPAVLPYRGTGPAGQGPAGLTAMASSARRRLPIDREDMPDADDAPVSAVAPTRWRTHFRDGGLHGALPETIFGQDRASPGGD